MSYMKSNVTLYRQTTTSGVQTARGQRRRNCSSKMVPSKSNSSAMLDSERRSFIARRTDTQKNPQSITISPTTFTLCLLMGMKRPGTFAGQTMSPCARLRSLVILWVLLRIGRVSVPIRLLVYFSCAEAAEVSAGQGPAGQVKVSFLCL